MACALWSTVITGAPAQTVGARGEDTAPGTDGPFNVLEWAGGVVTSRNGHAVWVSIASTQHRARIPEHDREVGPPEHGASLHVECRAAGGGLPESFPPAAARGGIYLDNHPEQPDAYTVLDPMYWVLGLAGRSEERWPVKVRIGTDRAIASALVRSRTDYSAPRPGLDIALPGQAVIDAIMADTPIKIEAEGPNMRLVARFTASENARRAGALMRVACPRPTDEETRIVPNGTAAGTQARSTTARRRPVHPTTERGKSATHHLPHGEPREATVPACVGSFVSGEDPGAGRRRPRKTQ